MVISTQSTVFEKVKTKLQNMRTDAESILAGKELELAKLEIRQLEERLIVMEKEFFDCLLLEVDSTKKKFKL